MKPCPNRRQTLALLASEAADQGEATILRDHLAGCPGCRSHLEELVRVHLVHTEAAAHPPRAQASAALYHRVAAGIRRPERGQSRLGLWGFGGWRLGLTAGCALAAFLVLRQPAGPTRVPPPPTAARPTRPAPEATLLSYNRAFAQSPEVLDALLARSVSGSAAAPAPTLRFLQSNSDL